MPWTEVFAAFVVCHLAGDFLLQTEFQAANKRGGLGPDRVRRRALLSHSACYTLAYTPVVVWLAGDISGLAMAGMVAGIGVPHCIQDDGRLLGVWMRRVKHTALEPGPLAMMVDQSFHVLVLFGLAVAVGN